MSGSTIVPKRQPLICPLVVGAQATDQLSPCSSVVSRWMHTSDQIIVFIKNNWNEASFNLLIKQISKSSI